MKNKLFATTSLFIGVFLLTLFYTSTVYGAAGCTGTGCDGKDPEAQSCGNRETLSWSQKDGSAGLLEVRLRSSGDCKANWSLAISWDYKNNIWTQIANDKSPRKPQSEQKANDWWIWTPMLSKSYGDQCTNARTWWPNGLETKIGPKQACTYYSPGAQSHDIDNARQLELENGAVILRNVSVEKSYTQVSFCGKQDAFPANHDSDWLPRAQLKVGNKTVMANYGYRAKELGEHCWHVQFPIAKSQLTGKKVALVVARWVWSMPEGQVRRLARQPDKVMERCNEIQSKNDLPFSFSCDLAPESATGVHFEVSQVSDGLTTSDAKRMILERVFGETIQGPWAFDLARFLK